MRSASKAKAEIRVRAMYKIDMEYILGAMKRFIETPSPTGYYVEMKPVIEEYAAELGYDVTYDNKDTAYIKVEGEDTSKTVCISAHADTLGLMVRAVNSDGTLRVRALGGTNYSNIEGENVTVHTRSGKKYTGLLICKSHSAHAFDDAKTLTRDENTVFVLLDEKVNSVSEVRELGICNGDYISIDPRFTLTDSGYVKSRYIDNKAAMAISFATIKYLKENNIKPKYNTYFTFSFYEEIGLGGVYVPDEVSEYVSVDISIIGPDSDGDEYGVTICAKDAKMPYDYALVNRLVSQAEKAGCKHAIDLFYRYGSDASQAISAGNNVRSADFGMAVYCSHGVERAHVDGIRDTAKLTLAYVLDI